MPGLDPLSAVSGLAGNIGSGLTGIISGIVGIGQKKKGNAILAANPRPVEGLPEELSYNEEQAKGMAQNGLPSEQYQQAKKNIQNSQAAAIASATDRRSGNASIGAIQQGTDNAYGGLDVANAEARRQNQLNLQTVNNQVGSFKDKLFDWNQRQKYIENYNMGNALVGQGNANLIKGIDKFASGVIGAGAGGLLGGGGGAATTASAPSANYDMSAMAMAPTRQGTVGSPASAYQYLDPNGFSSSALIGG